MVPWWLCINDKSLELFDKLHFTKKVLFNLWLTIHYVFLVKLYKNIKTLVNKTIIKNIIHWNPLQIYSPFQWALLIEEYISFDFDIQTYHPRQINDILLCNNLIVSKITLLHLVAVVK